MKAVLYILLITLVAGCAGTKKMRGYSQNMALHLDQLEGEIKRFSDSRNALAKARMRNMLTLDQGTLEFRQDQELMLHIWNSMGDERAKHYEDILRASEIMAQQEETFNKKRQEHEKIINDAEARLNFRSDKIDDLQKILLQYSKKGSFKDDVTFYIGFFKEVRNNVKESLDSLESSTEDQVEALEITDQ